MGKLDGKVAFITGVARGQGRSHAIRLAEEGAAIIGIDICESIPTMNYPLATPEDLAQTVKEVEAVGGRILASKADVRDRDQLAAAIAAGVEEFGSLDIVVANAGIMAAKDVGLLSGFIDSTDVDLIGVMNTVAAAVPHLQGGASIILTGSTAALLPGATDRMGPSGGAGYGWAKRTLLGYTETVALQLAPHMIRLNMILPTNTDTDLLHNEDVYKAFRPDLENPTREDAMLALPVMQAMPIPFLDTTDVSELVLFLASDASRYLTGMNIRLDGGALLKTPPDLQQR